MTESLELMDMAITSATISVMGARVPSPGRPAVVGGDYISDRITRNKMMMTKMPMMVPMTPLFMAGT